MNVQDFKLNTINKLNNLIDQWFDNGIQDGIINGVLKSLIKNNQNKYDELIKLFVDEDGNVDLNELHKQLDKHIDKDIEIDLKSLAIKLNIPSYIVPNKILFLTKNDILKLI